MYYTSPCRCSQLFSIKGWFQILQHTRLAHYRFTKQATLLRTHNYTSPTSPLKPRHLCLRHNTGFYRQPIGVLAIALAEVPLKTLTEGELLLEGA